ncbi:hypothetical protein ACLQ25_30200, partial [Micromonospora sp. DT44]|uniref:hypothetical protein n=1 Tax=Micromonospora sp. DT44 TaxID=3393439 RepID=UPI003CF9F6A4
TSSAPLSTSPISNTDTYRILVEITSLAARVTWNRSPARTAVGFPVAPRLEMITRLDQAGARTVRRASGADVAVVEVDDVGRHRHEKRRLRPGLLTHHRDHLAGTTPRPSLSTRAAR